MTGIPFLIVFLYKEYLIFQAAPLFFLDKFWGIRSRTFYQHCVGSFSCICGCFVPICFPILCRTMAPVSVSIRFGGKKFLWHAFIPSSHFNGCHYQYLHRTKRQETELSCLSPNSETRKSFFSFSLHHSIHFLIKLKAGLL